MNLRYTVQTKNSGVRTKKPFTFVFSGILLFALCAALNGIAQDTSKDASSSARDTTVYHVGDGVTPPKAIFAPDPQYSEKGRRQKISGTVLLGLIVQPDGTVRSVTVTRSLEKSLDEQAVKTVDTWKFQPATKDGKPVAVRIEAEVSFKIR